MIHFCMILAFIFHFHTSIFLEFNLSSTSSDQQASLAEVLNALLFFILGPMIGNSLTACDNWVLFALLENSVLKVKPSPQIFAHPQFF